jgi:hypothetical protein
MVFLLQLVASKFVVFFARLHVQCTALIDIIYTRLTVKN